MVYIYIYIYIYIVESEKEGKYTKSMSIGHDDVWYLFRLRGNYIGVLDVIEIILWFNLQEGSIKKGRRKIKLNEGSIFI